MDFAQHRAAKSPLRQDPALPVLIALANNFQIAQRFES
jgi:hypothetical protein